MYSILSYQSLFRRKKNQIALAFFLICAHCGYSQNIFCKGNEIGVSKIDSTGMMSQIIWTKSAVAVLMNAKKDCIHVFLTNASRSQFYSEVKFIKKVETS